MDQGELVLRPQGVEAASGGRDGSGLQDAVVIVPSGTAVGDSAVGAGPADGSTDGPPMTLLSASMGAFGAGHAFPAEPKTSR